MKVIKKIIGVIIAVFISIVILFNIYNFINIKVLKNDLTKIGGYSILEVVSGSMEPTIKVGDLILIDTNAKKYEVDDIVTFYDVNGSFVTHRIISIDKNIMVTQGDNNNTKDEPIDMKNIVGKFVYKMPFLGSLLSSFKSPVFLTVILLIGILFCYLISTDENGKLIEDKKENSKVKKNTDNKKNNTKKKTSSKEITKKTTRKVAEKKAATKKTAEKPVAKTATKNNSTKQTTKKAAAKTNATKKVDVKKQTTKKETPKKVETKKTTAKKTTKK